MQAAFEAKDGNLLPEMRYVSEVLQDKDMNVFPESVTDNSIKCIMDSCNAMGDKFLTPLCVEQFYEHCIVA